MKKIHLIIIALLVNVLNVNSQTSDEINLLLAPNDTVQQIKDIEKTFQTIKDNISNFQLLEVFRDSLSFRDVYLKNNVLQLIIVQFIENRIEKNVEWYFVDQKLIYAESNWINLDTKAAVSNSKCYFTNLHMIKWENEKVIINPNSPEFKARETQLVDYSKRMWVNAMDLK
jgi:hypothetical protein